MGSRTVIASVVPVPDAATKRLMISLHSQLTAGDRPSVALATAQQGLSATAGRIRLPGHRLRPAVSAHRDLSLTE